MTAATSFVPPAERFGAATLPEILRQNADGPGRFCLVRHGEDDRHMRLGDLAARTAVAAARLRERGVQRGDRVCLLAPTSLELLVAIWGVWAAGGVVVVLPHPLRLAAFASQAEELQRRLEQASARLLLVDDDYVDLVPASFADVTVLGLADLDQPSADSGHVDVAQDDLALLQFTSGTTARSRAVALTHKQLLSNVSALGDALALTAEDRGVSWLPLFHDMGMIVMIAEVALGGELILLPTEGFARRPGGWLDAVSRFRASIIVGPSTAYALATKDLGWRPRELDLSTLRVVGNGAEPVDPSVLAAFTDAASRYGMSDLAVCPMYGLAEATLAVTTVRPGQGLREISVSREELDVHRRVVLVPRETRGSRRLVCCGAPVPGAVVEIRDGAAVLGEGRVGEVCVRAPSLMAGYWQDPAATAEVLDDGWLRTGDLGFLDQGEMFICGRSKDLIIVSGRNLYPEDYEQLAANRDGVRRGSVVAFGLPETERMAVVVEARVGADGARQLAAELMEHMTHELAHAPEEVLVIRPGALPKTSSGKVQRSACRDRYRAGELPVIASAVRR